MLTKIVVTLLVGMAGWNDGEPWGSGDRHQMSSGIKGEGLDMARGAGLQF
jgi:hypothetical protein